MFFLDVVLVVEVDFHVHVLDVVVGEVSVHLVLGEDFVSRGDVDLVDYHLDDLLGVPFEVED